MKKNAPESEGSPSSSFSDIAEQVTLNVLRWQFFSGFNENKKAVVFQLYAILSYVVIIGFFGVLSTIYPPKEDSDRFAEISLKIDSLTEDTKLLKIQIRELLASSDGTNSSPNISALKVILDSHEDRLRLIDTAILENPSKALSVPMLRMDLEALKKNNELERLSTTKEIERIYTLATWFVGLILTAIISPAIPAVFAYFLRRKTVSGKTKKQKSTATDHNVTS